MKISVDFHICISVTLKRLKHSRNRKNELPSTQKKLTHFSDKFDRPGICQNIMTRNWYVNKTDFFVTFLQRLTDT